MARQDTSPGASPEHPAYPTGRRATLEARHW
jgi:hypothetical protein